MNKYVVAYLSLHERELLLEIVEANSDVEAAKSYLDWEHMEDVTTMQEIQEITANGDVHINVLQIDKTNWRSRSNAPSSAMPVSIQ